jgi:rod shape-determining protein MreD
VLRVLIPLGAGVIWLILATALAGFLPSLLPPPDVVLIVVISFGFQYTLPLGGGLSFLLGILQDVLSGGVIGLNALSKTVVFALTRSIAQRFYFSNLASKIAMVFLGGIICTGLLSPIVLVITPQVTDFSEKGDGDTFHYGKTKTRTRGI